MRWAGKLPKGIKHSFWSVVDAAFYPAVYLASVPLLMKGLGLVGFGLWIVLNSLITVLQLLNFNLGLTAIRNVSYELADDNTTKARDVINGILHISLLLLLAATAVGIFLSFVAVRNGWWGLDAASSTDVSACVILAAVIAGLKYFDQVFQNIIKAKEYFRLAAILNMINRFGLLVITLLMAIQGYSLSWILWANVAFLCIYLALQFFSIRVIMPFYSFGRLNDRGQYSRLFHFSKWPWLQSLAIVLAFQTDRFWVSSYAGLSEVSGYGLVSTMFNHIHMIFVAMAAWMLPRIAAMTSKGNDPSALYHKVRGGLFGVVVSSLLFFYFISPYLFRLWVGEETYGRMYTYIGAFVAFEIVYAHTIMPTFYLNAAGKERMATWLTFLYCGACYVFMLAGLWIFHSPLALIGGMTLGMAITVPVVNIVTQKSMRGSYSWEHGIYEMAPMYMAIVLIYTNNIWVGIALLALILLLLWKYYLSEVFNGNLWKRTANT